MNRLADLRDVPRTMQEACQVFADLVHCECKLAREQARKAVKVAALNQEHEEKAAPIAAQRDQLAGRIKRFILANPHLFTTPRKHKTDGGSFGLQAVSEVDLADEAIVAAYLKEHGFDDCYKEKVTLVKEGIKSLLKAGQPVPGATIREGDTAVYKVAPSLLKQEAASAHEEMP